MLKHLAIPFVLIGLLVTTAAQAQVKIGDDPQTIDAASLLELQSSDKVLVITRVDSLQMTTIVPNRGAMVYNTTADCIYYYDGAQWNNMCNVNGEGGNLTADPLVNDISTIVITPTADGSNFEIAPNSINSEQIVNGGINGIDIQDGSIGQGKLQNNSVTQDKLSENSVGAFALDNDNINLSDFTNDEGFITNADIISNDLGNAISAGTDNGAFYDDSGLQTQITTNATNIAADGDTDATNEIQSLELNNGNELSITGVTGFVTLPTADGSDTKIENGTNTIVSGNGTIATPYAINITGVDISDTNELQDLLFDDATNILTLSNPASSTNQVDLSALAGGGGTDDQNAGEVPVAATPANYTAATADVEAHLAGIDAALAGGGGGSTEVVDGTTLTGTGTAANPFKIEPSATNGQFLTTDASGDVVWANVPATGTTPILSEVLAAGNGALNQQIKELLDPTAAQDAATKAYVDATVASGGALTDGSILIGGAGDVAQQLEISGDATMDNAGVLTIQNDSITSLKIKDATIALEDFSDMGADADGQVMRWSETNGQWEIASAASHTGQSKSIFFADENGDPSQFFHPTNGNPSFIWDYEARVVSGRAYGALGIGLDGQAINNNVKVHIIDNVGGNVSYPLEVQNRQEGAGSAVGILFAHDRFNDGKGSLVFQRTGNFGVGDFHFVLNNNSGARQAPQLASDKAFTIQNDGDIVLYNGIEIAGDRGDANQVLTSNGAGAVSWEDAGGSTTYTGGAGLTLTGTTFAVNDLAGEVTGPTSATVIADDVIGTDELTVNAVFEENINANAVTSAKIAPNTITLDDLNNMGATTNGQILKWDQDNLVWTIGTDNGGSTTYTGGDGLTLSGTNDFSVNVDGATIETASDILQVRDAGITNAKLDKANIPLSGFGVPTASIDLNTQKIVNLGTPTLDADAATKKYVDDNAGANLSTTDLTQTFGEDRTYNLNGSNLYFDGAGLIGIGTTTPAAKFHVSGGQVRAATFSAGDGFAYGFSSDPDTGVYRVEADQIGFDVGGFQALTIDEPSAGITNVTVKGAFSTNIRTEAGGGSIFVADDDHTVIIGNATTVNLPAPSTGGTGINVGKIYILKNITGGAITIDSFIDSVGTPSTSLPAGVTQLQSDGSAWHQIN
ncbi:hypothetical protein [Pseudozobellia sp. WGM2]|uniref:beta strand repeat-containing protein n=1 Tax=Pseudozobellia sp. WGM2 TaxID=2787625 RepID=UPI001AE0A033|nr:hypothetical protein [Pseudozobellia sp. WGM2]